MASMAAQGRTVTVSVDKMVFERPVRVGQAIGMHAELLHVGTSSMDIKLEVWARRLLGAYEAEHQLVTEGLFFATWPSMSTADPAGCRTIRGSSPDGKHTQPTFPARADRETFRASLVIEPLLQVRYGLIG